jgi:predicted DNA binding protein
MIYATREDAFTPRERAGFDVIGRTVGFAIHAARSRELLFADTVVELTFDVTNADLVLVDAARALACDLTLEGYVSSGDRWILYVAVDGAPVETALDALSGDSRVERARAITETNGGGRIELVVTEWPLVEAVTAAGATVCSIATDADGGRLLVEAPVDVDARELVEHVKDVHPAAAVLSRREEDRDVTTVGRPGGPLDTLTERQREVLEAAYRAGYYSWSRESTAEEVAASLDIAPATLHAHLRKAEQSILSVLLDST